MPSANYDELLSLCTEFSDIFALGEDSLSVNNFYTQDLRLSGSTPVYTKNYRTVHSHIDEINSQTSKLLMKGAIEPSHSCYNSPILLVPKKSANGSKKWRMVIDYRKLNSKLIPDKHPLPRIDSILDGLGGAKFFSTLDFFSGFHQIPLNQESKEYTAFSTNNGIFHWNVLPFGG